MKKKAKSEQNPSDDEFSEPDSSEQEIDVEFEAFGICDKDVDGVTTLLKHSFAGEELDVREIATILANQDGRGCVFMTALDDDDDKNCSTSQQTDTEIDNDVYGVVSFIDLSEHKDKKCVRQLCDMLAKYNAENENAVSKRQVEDFLSKIDSGQLSFLINERLSNLPYHIALPAFQDLSKEIERSSKKFNLFLMVLKTQILTEDGATRLVTSKKQLAKSKKRKFSKIANVQQHETGSGLLYLNPEEEFLAEECLTSFDYVSKSVDDSASASQVGSNNQRHQQRKVIFFNRQALCRFIQKLSDDIQPLV